MSRLGLYTDLSTANNNYYILTDKLGTYAANSAVTLPTDYNMKVMFGENSTTYYTLVKDINTDCKTPFTDNVDLALEDSSPQIYIKNEDGTINSAANANPADANQDGLEFTVTLKAGSDKYFGNPNSVCQNVVTVEFPTTYIRDITGGSGKADGLSVFSPNSTNYTGKRSFAIPKSADGKEITFNIQVSTAGTAPHDGNENPILHFYDCDIDKNEDTLALIEGIEDEDYNVIAQANQTKILYLS
jgi:hypothetical protein